VGESGGLWASNAFFSWTLGIFIFPATGKSLSAIDANSEINTAANRRSLVASCPRRGRDLQYATKLIDNLAICDLVTAQTSAPDVAVHREK
jgi:hypothetical protein